MKKQLLPSLFLLAGFALSFTACKKEDKGPSRSEIIVGQWDRVTGGEDRNNNGTLETDEQEINVDGTKTFYTFKSDGTGSLTIAAPGVAPVGPELTWKITGTEENYIEILYTNRGLQPFALLFTEFTAQQFQVRDTIYAPHYFSVYHKR